MKFLINEIRKQKEAWIVLIFISIFILLRLPSLVEPYWYGDEGIYQVIGKAINSGRLLYQDIWDNKPPLLYFIYSIFNGDQFLTRSFSLAVGAFSVLAFFILGKKLFRKESSNYIATLVYVFLFGSPIIEGNIANAENFMHLPIILSAILFFQFKDKKSLKLIFFSGLLLSIAFMIKIVAVFEFSAFILFLILIENRSQVLFKLSQISRKEFWKSKSLFLCGFIVVPVFFIIIFTYLGALPDFLSGVLSENIDYVGEENALFLPMGILLIKTLILIASVVFIILNIKKISEEDLFIYLWLTFSLFSTFFSQRPYYHYILMSALPFAYLIGSILDSKRQRLFKVFLSIVILIVVYLGIGIYKKPVEYYKNYFEFIFFDKKIDDYYKFFDSNTHRDYELARFVRMFVEENESVFIWSDSGQIYALSDTLPPGKYIVAYHITYYNNAVDYMVNQISKNEPRYIIKTKESPEFRNFLPSYVLKYKVANSDIYERQN